MPKSSERSKPRAAARWRYSVTLLLFAFSATACGTRQTPPSECPVNPMPPVSAESLPSERYSTSARRDMESWQNVLTGTPATSAR